MGFYRTDGNAIKSLGIDDVLGAGFESSLANQYDFTPRAYYTLVSFMRRAVHLRCNAVAGVPITLQRGETDISGRPEFAALMGGIAKLIWRTEFALCLSPYGAYWRRSANAIGLNPTPEWLLPQACWPFITATRGLESIRYIHPWGVPNAGTVEYLPLDAVVYFWYPSLDRANWPGTPPGTTALAAASALTNRDAFVAQYFKQGAIKGTLLQVPQSTQQAERDKLKSWWRQVVAGIANAWQSNVISADVKPIVIGDSLKDTESDSLTTQYRQDIAAAFEVPESVLMAHAANYATANVEHIAFYEETVFPELALILDMINTQWLREQYDCELIAHPEQTEARQDTQVQQATAITELVGQSVLTVDEGRAWLGMEPMTTDQTEPDTVPDEDADYQAMEHEEDAEEQADDDAAKALYGPGQVERSAARAVLRGEHRATREQIRARHKQERGHVRVQHLEARRAAPDAGARLRLVQRQRAELDILTGRQAAERSMLRSLHTAERGRLRDRHAVARAFEARIQQNGHEVLT